MSKAPKFPNSDNGLLSIEEAANFLGVSRATFNKIRQENNVPEVMVGKRPRFIKNELLSVLSRRTSYSGQQKKRNETKIALNILSSASIDDLEVKKNVFDLRLINQIDPYGALSLLCLLIVRAQKAERIDLLIDDKHICQYLKTIHFFYHLECEGRDRIQWDHEALHGTSIQDTSILMPINSIKTKGGERIIAENLLKLLRQQGFKDSVGRGISLILGELADNAMTHSQESLSDRVCYISAKRFLWGESNCVIVGVADTGLGIVESLKKNPQYAKLPDKKAFLEAFRPFVTSWAGTPRGKGLTDVLSIALGNDSLLRVDVGDLGISMDLREKDHPKIEFIRPMASEKGTRFGLILIDTNFEKTGRKEVDVLIAQKVREQ